LLLDGGGNLLCFGRGDGRSAALVVGGIEGGELLSSWLVDWRGCEGGGGPGRDKGESAEECLERSHGW